MATARIPSISNALFIRLRQMPAWLFVLWLVASLYIVSLLIGSVGAFMGASEGQIYRPETIISRGIVALLILGSFVAPILETLAFQWAPKRLLDKAGLRSIPLYLTISSLLFGISHSLEPLSLILMVACGLVLAIGFVARDTSHGHAILLIALVHAIRNTISTVVLFLS